MNSLTGFALVLGLVSLAIIVYGLIEDFILKKRNKKEGLNNENQTA